MMPNKMMTRLKKTLREPLVHFLLIGASLFLMFFLTQESGSDTKKRIVLSPSQMGQLAAQFQRTWLRQPSEQELDGLVKGYVRDEIYYREALALGLDQNDPQVRLRMRMKLEFLLEDLTTEAPPDDGVLLSYLRKHADTFRTEPRISFQQVYLNPDLRPDLEADVQSIRALLKDDVPIVSLGDQTMLPSQYKQVMQSDIARSFGDDFATRVVALAPGEWSEPLVSQLGVHLVKVSDHIAGYLPSLAEVRLQVEREYLAQRRMELKDMAYAKIRENYEVVIEPPAVPEGKAGEAMAATRSVGSSQ